jgi:hypothetical protein
MGCTGWGTSAPSETVKEMETNKNTLPQGQAMENPYGTVCDMLRSYDGRYLSNLFDSLPCHRWVIQAWAFTPVATLISVCISWSSISTSVTIQLKTQPGHEFHPLRQVRHACTAPDRHVDGTAAHSSIAILVDPYVISHRRGSACARQRGLYDRWSAAVPCGPGPCACAEAREG